MTRRRLQGYLHLALIGGLALFLYLLLEQGIVEVATVLSTAGLGLLWVVAFHLVPMAADAAGWHLLIPAQHRASLGTMLWARWVGEAVNGLLPVAQVGGDVVKARLLTQRGVPAVTAGASVVVDLTVAAFTQILFTLLGLGLLVAYLGGARIIATVVTGTAIMGLLVAGFYVAQRRGLFSGLVEVLGRFVGKRDWQGLVGGAAALDRAITVIYRDRRVLLAAGAWRLLGWIAGTGEVWLAMYVLGHPVGLTQALLLESLIQAVRAAAFAVPGALGIQEGGYLVLGTLLGLDPSLALALALTKRVRELMLGIPGLIAWQFTEGHRWWRRRVPSEAKHSCSPRAPDT